MKVDKNQNVDPLVTKIMKGLKLNWVDEKHTRGLALLQEHGVKLRLNEALQEQMAEVGNLLVKAGETALEETNTEILNVDTKPQNPETGATLVTTVELGKSYFKESTTAGRMMRCQDTLREQSKKMDGLLLKAKLRLKLLKLWACASKVRDTRQAIAAAKKANPGHAWLNPSFKMCLQQLTGPGNTIFSAKDSESCVMLATDMQKDCRELAKAIPSKNSEAQKDLDVVMLTDAVCVLLPTKPVPGRQNDGEFKVRCVAETNILKWGLTLRQLHMQTE
jgi:hypothetical protein